MNAASAPVPPNPRWRGLGPRVISALALAVPVIAAVYFGPPWFTALIIIAAALMGWEWVRMSRAQPLWLIIGAIYIALPCGALIWLRGTDDAGMVTVAWLLAVVWSADIGAFIAGRTLGGPKLAPRISPKKTWSGFIGGVTLAAAVAAGAALIWEGGDAITLALWGLVIAVASQICDLIESAAKRHFDVKDSSNLIPGHGGVLDRVDALILAAMALAALKLTLGRAALPWL